MVPKRIVVLLVLLLSAPPAILAFDENDSAKVVLSSCEYILEDGLMVRYQTLQDDPLIHWELRYESEDDSSDNNVWIGLGFAPNGTMVGSTVVIGVPSSEEDEVLSSSADVYYLAARSIAGVAPLPEGANTTTTTAIQFVINDDTNEGSAVSEGDNTTTASSSPPTMDAPSLSPTEGPTVSPTEIPTMSPTSSPSLGSTTATSPPVEEEPAKTTTLSPTLSPTVTPVNPPPTMAPTKRSYQAPVAAPSFFDEWFRQLEEIDLQHHRVLHTQHHRLELFSDTITTTQSLKFQSSPDWHLEHDLIYAIGNGPLLGYHAQRGLIPRSVLLMGNNETTSCTIVHDDKDEDDDTSSPAPTTTTSTSAPSSSSSSTPPTVTSTVTTTNVDRLNQVEEEENIATKGIYDASSSSSFRLGGRLQLLSALLSTTWILLLASIVS